MNASEILDMIGDTKGSYIWDAQQFRGGEMKSPPLRPVARKRVFLIAALIAVALFLVGCGAYVITRNLGGSWSLKKDLVVYNDTTQIGAVSKNWFLNDAAVELSVAPPTGTTLEITCQEWGLNAEGTLEIGEEYWIEKWDGVTYRELPTIDGKPWIVPVREVACGSESKWNVDYQASYGTLEPGNYRIGMMVSQTDENGRSTELGCFAKFRIHQTDIAPYLETYQQALNNILNSDAYHVILTEYMENFIPDSEYAQFRQDIWKSGKNFVNCMVVKDLGASDWRTEGAGQLLRDGSGYGISWNNGEISPKPKSWSKLDFVTAGSFTWSSHFESAYAHAEDVEALDTTVNIITSIGLGELSYFEIRVQYDDAGNITHMEYAEIPDLVYSEEDRILWFAVDVVPTTQQEAASVLKSIDVTNPPAFSYREDMAQIESKGYLRQTSGFANTAVGSVPDVDSAVKLAKAEVPDDTNVTKVYYDPSENIWKVVFTYSQDDRIYHAVYMDRSGVTLLVASK